MSELGYFPLISNLVDNLLIGIILHAFRIHLCLTKYNQMDERRNPKKNYEWNNMRLRIIINIQIFFPIKESKLTLKSLCINTSATKRVSYKIRLARKHNDIS